MSRLTKRQAEVYRQTVRKNMRERQRGYVASAIDCDGHLTAYCGAAGNIVPEIGITNTSKSMLVTVRDWVGFGKVVSRDRDPRWKPVHDLRWSGSMRVNAVLTILYPYFLRKKAQAGILLGLTTLQLRFGGRRGDNRKNSQKKLKERLQELNKTGR